MPFEFAVLDWFDAVRCPLLDWLSVFLNHAGMHGELWIALALVLLLRPKTRRCGFAVALALILHLLVCDSVLKPLIARPRPCDVRAVAMLVPRPNGWSFPSGHTASAFAAAAALCFQKSRLGLPAVLLAAFIGLTRLYLYVHFPTDVLAGALFGTLLGFAASKLANAAAPMYKRLRNK